MSDAPHPALRDALVAWFRAARRDLPWRRTRDPYAIWVSEVMLQQTRVDTVIPYYTRFLRDFPTARALADAPESEVLARWSGIGYYRRARLLHAAAKAVVERHGGELPADHAQLRALPGVGDYTAGAVGSIAFGLAVPLVDGNVERVLCRLFAIPGDPKTTAVKRRVWSLAAALVVGADPGDLNQALMELGATVCAPTSPRCLTCPARAWCAGAREGDPARYPEKPARARPPTERWRALIATRGDAIWLSPSAMDRWKGMLIPPMTRGDDPPAAEVPLAGRSDVGVVVHTLTNARMEITVALAGMPGDPPWGAMIPRSELGARAVPKVTRALIQRALGDAPVTPRAPRGESP
ncbi:MAG: A/G-specific adenine glycosylase [Polyangiales bacterium]